MEEGGEKEVGRKGRREGEDVGRKGRREGEAKCTGDDCWSRYTMVSAHVLRIKNFNIKEPTNVPCLEGTY